MSLDEELVRRLAFEYVDRLSRHGEIAVRWADLATFRVGGARIPLVSQQGIFKPAALGLPISIRTTYRPLDVDRPYEDEVDDNGYLIYRYRGADPEHRENRLLRIVMEEGVSLLYFVGVATGLYQAHGAAIIEDSPGSLAFGVQLFPIDVTALGTSNAAILDAGARRYYIAEVKKRAGQAAFRESVLAAYSYRCTLCRLGHRELLDAAHIVPDAEGGPPVVTNGLSMCKIHHAAYDADIVGVRPDYRAEVRLDVLNEVDGPMLRHGLQELQGATITVPRFHAKRPSRDALEERYSRFLKAY